MPLRYRKCPKESEFKQKLLIQDRNRNTISYLTFEPTEQQRVTMPHLLDIVQCRVLFLRSVQVGCPGWTSLGENTMDLGKFLSKPQIFVTTGDNQIPRLRAYSEWIWGRSQDGGLSTHG